MARLIYSATMSLDGFIAGSGGDMSWLTPFAEQNDLADRLMNETGALLVGARTYGGDDPNAGDPEHEGAFGGQWHGPQYVLTHAAPSDELPDDVFFGDDLLEMTIAAKAAAGEKYVNVLGADVARQCIEHGILDEVLVFIVPVLLGSGTRLFESESCEQVRLERVSVTESPLSTDVWYRVTR
ncbi:dihydrofolate reductase family protein [Agromyces atrinae]|uniref:Dihydrofolate reductase n=1 Tax=Agromyces atrinae TaxID=592376 RepID=A0A4Q2M8E7_9MICO|nr:dihydrofolate reductase family protein [Agromyces atrinae]NYD66286.1 dihydrofolate reductase [Agromyces atrinae]RXZ86613.1 dihydrofolate reductase [Agromyces atrinae]